MTTPRTRGWWRDHDYTRRSVLKDVEEFPGWGALTQLVEACETPLERAFIATLFETGARVSETLQLEAHHFEVDREEGVVVVRGMPRLKAFKKVSELLGGGWITEPVEAVRRSFPILLAEPLAPIMAEWVEQAEGLLFPSPRRPGKPLSRAWAYKLAGRLEEATGIPCWPHAFRSWRASQLVQDYNLQVLDLVDYFTWAKADVALHYSRRGWAGLLDRMKPLPRYV